MSRNYVEPSLQVVRAGRSVGVSLVASLRQLFEWVDAFPSSIALRGSLYLYPTILTLHLLSMGLFGGLVLMMDLRLIGVSYVETPFTHVQKRLFPWQIGGMAMCAATGAVLVFASPMRFWGNLFFWTKVMMMALAGINAMAFHLSTYESVAGWDASTKAPARARLAGALSIALWGCVVVCGRMIAYNWFTV